MDHQRFRIIGCGIFGFACDRLRLGVDYEHVRMVHNFAIAGAQFGGGHPHILREVRWHAHSNMLVGALPFQRVLRDREYRIGLADFPAIRKFRRRRHLLGIALRLGAIGPGGNGVQLFGS